MKYSVIIESLGLRFQMPLSHQSGMVSGFLKLFGKGRHCSIQCILQRINPVGMAVTACKNSCTTGSRNRVGTKTIVQYSPLAGYPPDIVCLGILLQYPSIHAQVCEVWSSLKINKILGRVSCSVWSAACSASAPAANAPVNNSLCFIFDFIELAKVYFHR